MNFANINFINARWFINCLASFLVCLFIKNVIYCSMTYFYSKIMNFHSTRWDNCWRKCTLRFSIFLHFSCLLIIRYMSTIWRDSSHNPQLYCYIIHYYFRFISWRFQALLFSSIMLRLTSLLLTDELLLDTKQNHTTFSYKTERREEKIIE